MASIDLDTFREREARFPLTCREHPTGKLVIWNYTQKCQFEQAWDEVTMQARGLITTPGGTIVARPFRKFFNLDQHQGDLPVEPFVVTVKADGSLGILYFLDGKPQIATRGSFTSDQAIKANELLHSMHGSDLHLLKPEYTYLFEIIYPTNRIVVDYGAMEDLVLLAVIHTETGDEVAHAHGNTIVGLQSLQALRKVFPVVKCYDGINDLEQLRAIQEENAEGFVIRFASGLRLKLKFADYIRLHRLITKVNARVIWDLLRNAQPFDELLERVPDEFYHWVKRTRGDLTTHFDQIERECEMTVELVRDLPTRKEQAAIIVKCAYPGVTFAMLDQKNYSEVIWKLLYPEASRPFAIDEDA
jgi:RNA ligase